MYSGECEMAEAQKWHFFWQGLGSGMHTSEETRLPVCRGTE